MIRTSGFSYKEKSANETTTSIEIKVVFADDLRENFGDDEKRLDNNRMGQSISRDDFIWTYTDQPHTSRRATIVKAHPEIKELFGIDESFKFVVIAMVLFQEQIGR
ncbi:sphingolipid Delta4-desaturase [Teladorsagia circumcincta]|uniref:Sphingolipid Delta4-desaturase n=1 Tax=Teladorsagia circumcincta TaxID=45464 RepID=A0A2G9V4A2_TELCI|nr:sphingolipid Delta4-desaturase [Teladorsagia circumcincta]